jgi:hypothetical protein
MLMAKSRNKPTPHIHSVPINVSRHEAVGCWEDGRFNVESLYRLLAEKAKSVVLRHAEGENYAQHLGRYKLREFSIKRVPRRFWGKLPLGYYVIRLHYGYGEYERKVALQFVRDSEDSFGGHLFNHPLRRTHAK